MSSVLALPAITIPATAATPTRSSQAPSIMISPSSSPSFTTAEAAAGLATISRQPNSAQRTRVHVRVACTMCKAAKVRCEGSRPCRYCVKHSFADKCVDSQQKKRGPKPKAQYKAGKGDASAEGEIVVVPRAPSSTSNSPRSIPRGRPKAGATGPDSAAAFSFSSAPSTLPLPATMSVSEVAMSPHSGLKHTASRRHHVATRTPSNTSNGDRPPSTAATVNVTVSGASLPTLTTSTSSAAGSDPSLHFITTDTRSSSPSAMNSFSSLLGDLSQTQANAPFLFDTSRQMHSSQLLGNVNLQLQLQHAMQLQQLQLQQQMLQPSSFPMGINMGLPLPMTTVPVMQLGMNGINSISMPTVTSTPSTAASAAATEAGPSPASAVSMTETAHSSFGTAESGTAAALPVSTLGSSTSAAFDSLAQSSSTNAINLSSVNPGSLPYNSMMQLPIGLPLSMLPMGSMNPVMRMPLLQDSSLFPFSSASNPLLPISSSSSQNAGNMYWPYSMGSLGQPLYYPPAGLPMTAASSDPITASLQIPPPPATPAPPSGVESMLSAAHLLGEVKDAAAQSAAELVDDAHEHASRKRTRDSTGSDGAEAAKRAALTPSVPDTPAAPAGPTAPTAAPEQDTMPTPSAPTPAADLPFGM